MAKFEEIGVIAVVDGFEAFVLKLTAMDKNVKKFGRGAVTASGGIRLLNLGLKTVAVAGAAAIAVMGAIAVGVVKIASESVQTAASFESAFAGILKTTNNLGTNLFNLTEIGESVFQQFRDLASEIPMSFEELAKIGEFAGQLGIPEQALAGFTETVAALGVSTELTTEEASLGLARLGNVYGITADKMADNTERLGSTIVFLGNNFNALEPEILNFASMMSGTAAAVNITQDELLAISTAFVSAGVRAEAGGSSIQRVLLEMSKSVQQGGSALQDWADATGLTAEEFSDLWGAEGGPAQAFNMFVQELAEAGEGASLILEDLDVDTIRVLRTFLAGAGAAEILDDALVGAASAWEQNTALAREAEIRYTTLDSQMQILKNRFRDMGATIGMMLIPGLQDLLTGIQPLIDGIEMGLEPAIQTIVDSIERNLIPALGNLFEAFTGISLEQLGATLPTDTLASQMEAGMVEFDMSGVEAVADGVKGIGEAAATHIENFSRFVDKLAIFVGLVKDGGFKSGIKAFAEMELGIDSESIEMLGKFVELAGKFLIILFLVEGAVGAIVPIMGGLGAAIGFLISPVGLLILAIGALIGLILTMGPTVATAFEQLGTIIRVKMEEAGAAISEWATQATEDIGIWAESFGATISEFFTVTLPQKIQEGIEAARIKWDEFKESIREKWNEIKEVIGEKWDEITEGIGEWIQDSIDAIAEFGSNFVQAGRDIVNGIVDGINEIGSQISDAIIGLISDALALIGIELDSNSPSKVFAREVGEPISEGVAMGVDAKAGFAENSVVQMATGTVQAAQMMVPQGNTTTQSIDKSFSIGDLNMTATPEDPISVAQRVAMVAQLAAGA